MLFANCLVFVYAEGVHRRSSLKEDVEQSREDAWAVYEWLYSFWGHRCRILLHPVQAALDARTLSALRVPPTRDIHSNEFAGGYDDDGDSSDDDRITQLHSGSIDDDSVTQLHGGGLVSSISAPVVESSLSRVAFSAESTAAQSSRSDDSSVHTHSVDASSHTRAVDLHHRAMIRAVDCLEEYLDVGFTMIADEFDFIASSPTAAAEVAAAEEAAAGQGQTNHPKPQGMKMSLLARVDEIGHVVDALLGLAPTASIRGKMLYYKFKQAQFLASAAQAASETGRARQAYNNALAVWLEMKAAGACVLAPPRLHEALYVIQCKKLCSCDILKKCYNAAHFSYILLAVLMFKKQHNLCLS